MKQSYTWPRIQFALARWVESVTGLSADAPPGPGSNASVVWTDYDSGTLPKPYASIQKLTSVNVGFANEDTRTLPTAQRFTITQTVVGEYVVANLIWSEVRTTVQGGDTLEDTRDKFLLALQATVDDTQEPLIFAADGTDDILVTAKQYAIPDVEAVQGLTVAVETEARAEVQSVQARYRVRFQLYGFSLDGDDSSDEYVSALQLAFETKDAIRFLVQYGVGPEGAPSTSQDVSAISGPLRERRVFFDASVATRRTTYDFDDVDDPIDLADPPVIAGDFG